jgi:anti-anti-sigma regulatory factor
MSLGCSSEAIWTLRCTVCLRASTSAHESPLETPVASANLARGMERVGAMAISDATNRALPRDSTSDAERTVILLAGVVDLESTERLDREFAEARRIGIEHVLLDMSELHLIDEVAISSVLRGIDTFRAADAALEIRYPSPMARQLFEMCTPLQILGIEFTPDPHGHSDAAALDSLATSEPGIAGYQSNSYGVADASTRRSTAQ